MITDIVKSYCIKHIDMKSGNMKDTYMKKGIICPQGKETGMICTQKHCPYAQLNEEEQASVY